MQGGRKLKLAIVLPSFAVGGAQRMVCELARSLDDDFIDAHIVCFAGREEGSFLEKKVEATGIPVVYDKPSCSDLVGITSGRETGIICKCEEMAVAKNLLDLVA